MSLSNASMTKKEDIFNSVKSNVSILNDPLIQHRLIKS